MNALTKDIANTVLQTLGKQAPQGVLKAIQKASANTGVNFSYMVQQAAVESSFNPEAKAKTSSASGLYQFIESTWLSMVDKYGEKHGIDTEGKSKKEILALRNDPDAAANMAAEFASENEKFLQDHWAKGEKPVGATDLYLAHFMGAGGASAFLNARDKNPLQQAALLFPDAAQANKSVFYDTKTGRPKNMDEVYAFFDSKFQIKDLGTEKPNLQTASTENPAPVAPDPKAEQVSSVFKQHPAHAYYGQVTQNNYIPRGSAALGAFPPISSGVPKNPVPDSYQSLLRSPVDLMLLSQLETLNTDKNDEQSKF